MHPLVSLGSNSKLADPHTSFLLLCPSPKMLPPSRQLHTTSSSESTLTFRKHRTTSLLLKSARHTMPMNTGHQRRFIRLVTLSCFPPKITAVTTNAKAKHKSLNLCLIMMVPTQSHTPSPNAQNIHSNFPTTPTPSLASMHTS